MRTDAASSCPSARAWYGPRTSLSRPANSRATLARNRASFFNTEQIRLGGNSMRLISRAALVLVTLAAMSVAAAAQDKVKLFVGYSYLRPSMIYEQSITCEAIIGCPPPPPVFVTTHPNLNGYEFSATYKLIPWLGITRDFSRHYGTV